MARKGSNKREGKSKSIVKSKKIIEKMGSPEARGKSRIWGSRKNRRLRMEFNAGRLGGFCARKFKARAKGGTSGGGTCGVTRSY